MNENTTKHTANTRLDARSEKVETAVTIDWSNISLEDTRKLASRTIIIAAQNNWRTDGVIPTEAVLDANEFANPTRKPRGPVDPKQALLKAFAAYQKENPEATMADFIATLA